MGYEWQPVASGMTPVPDADYLAWGVWLSVPDAAGATNPAAAGAFASGSDVFEVRAGLTGHGDVQRRRDGHVFGGRHGRILRRGRGA